MRKVQSWEKQEEQHPRQREQPVQRGGIEKWVFSVSTRREKQEGPEASARWQQAERPAED